MKRIFVCVLLLLSLAASLLLPALAAPAQYTLSAKGLAFLQEFESGATAMECRCYHGGEGRTKLKQLRYHTRDALTFLLGAALLGGIIALRCFGL